MRQFLAGDPQDLTLEIFKKFCEKYINENSELQVNISAKMRNKFLKLIVHEEHKMKKLAREQLPSISERRSIAFAERMEEAVDVVEDVVEYIEEVGRRLSKEISREVVEVSRIASREIIKVERRLSNAVANIGNYRKLKDGSGDSHASHDSGESHFSGFGDGKRDKGIFANDPPRIRLLRHLERELYDLIDSDIIPRWKKHTELVDYFLNNEPYPVGVRINSIGSVSSSKPARHYSVFEKRKIVPSVV